MQGIEIVRSLRATTFLTECHVGRRKPQLGTTSVEDLAAR